MINTVNAYYRSISVVQKALLQCFHSLLSFPHTFLLHHLAPAWRISLFSSYVFSKSGILWGNRAFLSLQYWHWLLGKRCWASATFFCSSILPPSLLLFPSCTTAVTTTTTASITTNARSKEEIFIYSTVPILTHKSTQIHNMYRRALSIGTFFMLRAAETWMHSLPTPTLYFTFIFSSSFLFPLSPIPRSFARLFLATLSLC